MRRMKIGDIDMGEGMIRLRSDQTKNKENSIITIPDIAVQQLKDLQILSFRPTWYLFGKGIKPNANKKCGVRSKNNRHREQLKSIA